MRAAVPLRDAPRDLRRRLARLDGLPLRPATARVLLGDAAPGAPPWPEAAHFDPGFALDLTTQRDRDPRALIASRPWWPADAGETLDRLWRHAVAVSLALRRLAAESGRVDPERWGRIGLLHNLGLWAVAAVAPEALAALLDLDGPTRRDTERAWLGIEATNLGRELAERWGADPALADAAWLHADLGHELDPGVADPEGLALLQQAFALAERTPWALDRAFGPDPAPPDARQRLLVAEVQIRCGVPFVSPEATPHEERLARAHAQLLLRAQGLEADLAARDRFLDALAASDPTDDLDAWADRAARAWCGEPGVTAARVERRDAFAALSIGERSGVVESGPPERFASVLPEGSRGPNGSRLWDVPLGRSGFVIQLRAEPSAPFVPPRHPAIGAWHAWANLVADRDRLRRRLEGAIAAHRGRVETQGADLQRAKLDALAEFADGAGHELNNPLAVIQGRAQLLLHRTRNPHAVRSLQAIVGQARRAHRILRDLMYVARPPAPRPRSCRPNDVLRACLADLQAEAEIRGVRLVAETADSPPSDALDPESLRHLAEVLARNALEATPPGGTVWITSGGDPRRLEWTVRDGGRGLDAREARHLFDPFFCGRSAGRGLGLGLPRAARAVALAGGELSWRSTPGRGTTFHLALPLAGPPGGPTEPPQRDRV